VQKFSAINKSIVGICSFSILLDWAFIKCCLRFLSYGSRGGLAIMVMRLWSQWAFQSLIQNVKKGTFGAILGLFCMKCCRGLLIRRRRVLLIPVHLCTDPFHPFLESKLPLRQISYNFLYIYIIPDRLIYHSIRGGLALQIFGGKNVIQ
jgi:hypothetical protein